MQREIKFRGQRVDNKEWVYGYYVKDPKGQCRIYLQPFEDASSNTYYIVAPETVSQLTGLVDKNGVEIYEGDIIEYTKHLKNSIQSFKAIVIYDDYYACFGYKKKGAFFNTSFHNYVDLHIDFLKHCEVIGNIYESPSLLEFPS